MVSSAKKIGIREVQTLEPNSTVWDGGTGAVPGFGARRQRGDVVSFILTYRVNGRQRLYTIGKFGALKPEEARREAQRLLAEVRGGRDPAEARNKRRDAVTMADLCDRYAEACQTGFVKTRSGASKKAATLATDKVRLAHIKARLGNLPVAAVSRQDVEQFQQALIKDKAGARRTMGTLGGLMSYAVRLELRPDSPVKGILRPSEGSRKRRLEAEEYAAFAKALRRSTAPIHAVLAMRFILLTGWRRAEVLNLEWSHLKFEDRTAKLPDTKTGESIRPLSNAAIALLRSVPKIEGKKFVFPALRTDQPMIGNFAAAFRSVLKLAQLPDDISPHVLRHSLASLAADLEYSDSTIAVLIGHKIGTITSRYIHRADAVLLAAADAVANKTLELMGEAQPEVEGAT